MESKVKQVLETLEARSHSEEQRLETLRDLAGSAVRDAASELMLDVGRDVGVMLNALVRLARARVIVEVGGSVGYSTLWLCEGAHAIDGRVISFEVDAGKRLQMQDNLGAAGLLACAEIRGEEVPAVHRELPEPIDLVFLDHWKELYVRDFDLLWPKVRSGGVVIADNILRPEKNKDVIAEYLRHVRRIPNARSVTLDVGDGIELTCKV